MRFHLRPISATVKIGAGAICTTVTAGAGIAIFLSIAAITMTTTMMTIDPGATDRIAAYCAGLTRPLERTASDSGRNTARFLA